MDPYLEKPETTKTSSIDENDHFLVGCSSMQGWRSTQEDAHNSMPSFGDNMALFAVYDGHGGSEVAEYCSMKLPDFLKDLESYKSCNYEQALKDAFIGFDATLLQDTVVEKLRQMARDNSDDEESDVDMEDEPGKASGCTAVVALLVGRELYVANAGDSRCVVCRGGEVEEMSYDHKPEDKKEFQRIRKAGGDVEDGRVDGVINLSRAIGDHNFKMNEDLSADEQMISAMPDVKRLTLTQKDEFMILACDGIWNSMTNEEVVEFVRQRMQRKMAPSQICEELLDNCLASDTEDDSAGCDNMTAVIVKFKPTLFGESNDTQPSRKRSPRSRGTGNVPKRQKI